LPKVRIVDADGNVIDADVTSVNVETGTVILQPSPADGKTKWHATVTYVFDAYSEGNGE
jgi:hypothetical protein